VKVSHLHSINEHLTAQDRVVALMGQDRYLQERVDPVKGGVTEAVRDDHLGAADGGAVGSGEALVGDLEPAVSLAGDRPGPQPALIGAAGLDVRAVPVDDDWVGDGEP
jgi:hypothetical protein